jgi:drug/metabolite transporter (DMT)-like permease
VIITSAALVYLVWSGLTGELRTDFQPEALIWAIAIALVSTILAIAAFFAGLRVTGASRASIISTLEPAVTVVLAGLVLSDTISTGQLAGGALILAAVLVVQLGSRR